MSPHGVCHAFVVLGLVSAIACGPAPPSTSAPAPERFDVVVDAFLDHFARRQPSIAAGNGIHVYDDRLEDFSAAAIATEVDEWKGLRARLLAIPLAGLTPDERVDHRIVGGLTDAWLLELETHRNWQKNLMPYAAAISDGVHNLMTMESSPADVRARRIIDKLRGVPLLLAAARANITAPPRVMAERGVRMLRGASGMLTSDVPVAFAALPDTSLKGGLLAATTSAAAGSTPSCAGSRPNVCPRPTRRSRWGSRASKRVTAPRSSSTCPSKRSSPLASANSPCRRRRFSPRRRRWTGAARRSPSGRTC
jgi:hypothetical protein